MSNGGIINKPGNYYISFNKFKNSNERSIYLSQIGSYTDVLVEDSSFYNIASSGLGGSLFVSTKGSFIQSRLCSKYCKCTEEGHFSYFATEKNTNYTNFQVDCSQVENGKYGVAFSSTRLYYGNIILSGTNISSCFARQTSSMIIRYANSTAQNYFCTYHNCSNNDGYCICYSGSDARVWQCNIIGNKAPFNIFAQQYYGLVSAFDCIFIDNISPVLIATDTPDSVVLYRCFFENNSGTISAATESMTTDSFSLRLMHLSTAFCNAKYKIDSPMIVCQSIACKYYLPMGDLSIYVFILV
ncbi:hypothetical protein TVAG_302180 [Trichomonas vaginalis G3]|uniref:Right handed beta helix domain-containing protein n=1 Tax=Trichomonas vaginalis (strain ATCC PRA-98 / G3) TaxID=412133 RepID=A2EGP3_TRIV3|nr:hypothetical protein TVAGG3_0173160 [Trichomonas vaginalis G3]EAY08131.1 hypothetical protein TVAG_302180 [Trichomonas vaginalis G3]KAI5548738.1 hypothetical protein TVAGG3_0173160 [Trichomonas vaginalis G3]|eukprot:XP_001320354.1 hypothetical protein [Trichomonas vaginalis G3]